VTILAALVALALGAVLAFFLPPLWFIEGWRRKVWL
jgi:hypothetical protein